MRLPPAILVFLPACAGCPPPEDTGVPRDPVELGDFALGVEYTQLGLAEDFGALGVGWAKTRLEAFEWGQSEPAAPVGGVHTYDWSCPDALILEYQAAGVVNLSSYLSPESPWGSVDAAGTVVNDIAPAPAHTEDFRLWVAALVERYDGDGVDDAPGLVQGVHHWVVGPEWTGFWPSGDHEDYLGFAELVAEEARAADPDVVLGTIPFFFADEFAGNEPTDAEIEAKMGAPYTLRNDNEGVAAILDRPDLFDEVSIHALGDYTEIPPLVRWLNAQMDDRGYRHPIVFDDAFPAGVLANGANYPTNYPVTATTYPQVYALLRAVARGETMDGFTPEAGRAWVDAYYGTGLVKKIITTRGEGVAGILIGNTEDWLFDEGASLRDTQVFLTGGAALMGLTDVTHPAGYDLCDRRQAGASRPATDNLALVLAFLGGDPFEVVERVGDAEGVRGYRFERGGVPSWVLWNEDGALHLPGEAEAASWPVVLEVPADIAEADVVTAVTAQGAAAERRTVPAEAGEVALEVGGAPVFVTVR